MGTESAAGVPIVEQVLISAAMCVFSAWLGRKLLLAERDAAAVAVQTIKASTATRVAK